MDATSSSLVSLHPDALSWRVRIFALTQMVFPFLEVSGPFWTPWEFLAMVVPCGRSLLGLMCLGKWLSGEA